MGGEGLRGRREGRKENGLKVVLGEVTRRRRLDKG